MILDILIFYYFIENDAHGKYYKRYIKRVSNDARFLLTIASLYCIYNYSA